MILRLGTSDPQVITVQNLLRSLGFSARTADGAVRPLEPDGIYGGQTEQTVMDFQKSQGLLVDGVVGPVTMRALQEAYTRRILETTAPTALAAGPAPGSERLPLVRVEADRVGEGYGGLFLRSDAAEAYNVVRQQIRRLGGLVTTSGGIRELSQGGGANRSMVSFHYVGLALDLYINSGMRDPDTDPYVIVREADPAAGARPFVRVWARCSPEEVAQQTLTGVLTYARRDGQLGPVTGPFVDLTRLFEDHGFARIKPRPAFWNGTSELAAEWWHFQFEKPLFPKVSTFGGELLRIYARGQVENTAPWSQRDRIFKIDWV